MGKREVYQRNHIPTSRKPQIAGFTAQAQKQAVAARIRALKRKIGKGKYPDKPVVIRDRGVLKAIQGSANASAQSIIDTYNKQLDSALGSLPDDITDAEYEAALTHFRDGVMLYNRRYLVPNQLLLAGQFATHQFFSQNDFVTNWTVEPDESHSPPNERCQLALAISRSHGEDGAPLHEYNTIPPYPFRGVDHPRCPHTLVPGEPDTETTPAVDDLWDGTKEGISELEAGYSDMASEMQSEYGIVGPDTSFGAFDEGSFGDFGGEGYKSMTFRHVYAEELFKIWMKAWDEAKHPRDPKGQWASGESGSLTAQNDPTEAIDHASTVEYATMQQKFLEGSAKDFGKGFPKGLEDAGAKDYLYASEPNLETSRLLSDAGAVHPELTIEDWNTSTTMESSLAVSEAARQVFGLSNNENDAAVSYAGRELAGEQWNPMVSDAKQFVQAQYKVTQNAFAKLGYKPTDTIDLYRGYGVSVGDVSPLGAKGWANTDVDMRGATSWTTSPAIARGFAEGTPDETEGYVAHSKVPVKNILSTAFTGLGTPSEQEMVVIGAPMKARVIDWTNVMSEGDPKVFWSKAYESIFGQKFNPWHDERGRFASSPDAGSGEHWGTGLEKTNPGGFASPTDQDIVDYEAGRSLSDPRVIEHIKSVIPDARWIGYSETPFFNKLNELQGTPIVTPETDPHVYEQHRNALFNAQDEEQVPIKSLIFTQPNVNTDTINWLDSHPLTGHHDAFVARFEGDNYLMDGHHRTVAEAALGGTTISAKVVNLDKPETIKPPLPLAPIPVFGVAKLYSDLFGKAFNPNEARDPKGKWTSSGGGSIEGLPPDLPLEANSRVERWANSGRYDMSVTGVREDSYGPTFTVTATPKVSVPGLVKATNAKGDQSVVYDPALARAEPPMFEWSTPSVKFNEGAQGYSQELPVKAMDGTLYRGISSEEMDSIKRTGEIKTTGAGNLDEAAEGTAFTTDPMQARSYAGGFAMPESKPSFDKPSYIIGITPPADATYVHPFLRPDPSQTVYQSPDNDPSNPERQIKGTIPASAITSIVEVRPYRMDSGKSELRPADGTYDASRYVEGSGVGPDGDYAFKLLKTSEVLGPKAKSYLDLFGKPFAQKINTEHMPAGTSQGGEFAPKDGGGSSASLKAATSSSVTPAPVPESAHLRAGDEPSVVNYPPTEQSRCASYVAAAVSKIAGMVGYNPNLEEPEIITDPRLLEGYVSGTSGIADISTGDQALMKSNKDPLTKDSGQDGYEVGDYLSNWDSYGADGDRTIFLSKAASDATGVPLTPHQQELLTPHGYNENFPSSVWGAADRSGESTRQGDALFRASYDETQAYYQAHPELTDGGLGKTVTLYRGISYARPPTELADVTTGETKTLDIGAKPLTSWTADPSMAEQFARDEWHTHGIGYQANAGYVLAAHIPVERLVGNGIVGFGRASQSEHIVLGGDMKVSAKAINVEPPDTSRPWDNPDELERLAEAAAKVPWPPPAAKAVN